ncbi:MAG TPA: SGNH/GDSL hydrolase family protein [Candidatus Sulfotelmatobacter sp.]|nr:SGNH/GDSL hydrolase family protein [Candidatus Sulfotelmatobacter sp.]
MNESEQRTFVPRKHWNLTLWIACATVLFLSARATAADSGSVASKRAPGDERVGDAKTWIGSWAAAAQPFLPKLQTYRNQSLRLIVHTSAGGKKVRIKVSNTYGTDALVIGAAHIARRSGGAEIDPHSDRVLKFNGKSSTTIAAGSMAVSDPVELEVPAVSDLAISLFFPEQTEARTTHSLAMQTSYVSPETGDATAAAKFPVGKTIHSWPFLTGVDVEASASASTIVAFGSSLTDGDGTTSDTNGRWPDVLAERLQKSAGGRAEIGVLNEGIIGNRLLHDSPKGENPFGAGLGEAGLARFERDVLDQAGVRYVIVGLGINDILFPAFSFTPPSEKVSVEDIISGYRQLIARGHQKGIRVIGTTNPPFEKSAFEGLVTAFYTPEREAVREKVNDWIRESGEFDSVVDLDAVVRDPNHPTQLLPAYDSGDHLHPNNAGCAAEANAFPLTLFAR